MSAATYLQLPEFYTWGFSSAPLQIHLSLEAVSGIRRQIQESEKVRGALSGLGLLTGDTPKPGITRILGSEPLHILDAASVEEATHRMSGEPIGFYRTTPVGTTAMPEVDRALAARLFRHPNSVFMLIEIGKSGIGDARFCFWSEEELFDWPVMLFPFNAEELGINEWRRWPHAVREPSQSTNTVLAEAASPAEAIEDAAPEPEPVPALLPAHPLPESIAPEPVVKRHQPTVTRRLALAAALAVAVGLTAVAVAYFRRGPIPAAGSQAGPRVEEQASLGLSVGRRGNDLLVSWNGNAAVIAKANFGMLLIRGSEVSRDVPLTVEELRAGSVVYASPGDEVRFQLNVVAGDQVAREFLTVVLPRIQENRAELTTSRRENSSARELPQSPDRRVTAPLRELSQFKPVEGRNPVTATPLRLEEPPVARSATPASAGALTVLNQLPVAAPAVVDLPAKGIPERETPPSSPASLSAAAYPPVATHQVTPAVPALLRGVLWRSTVVDVKVSVDELGRVTKAEAAPKPGMHPLLRDTAVQAARQWKFQPAQFNGHPVPAEIVVQFNFAASH